MDPTPSLPPSPGNNHARAGGANLPAIPPTIRVVAATFVSCLIAYCFSDSSMTLGIGVVIGIGAALFLVVLAVIVAAISLEGPARSAAATPVFAVALGIGLASIAAIPAVSRLHSRVLEHTQHRAEQVCDQYESRRREGNPMSHDELAQGCKAAGFLGRSITHEIRDGGTLTLRIGGDYGSSWKFNSTSRQWNFESVLPP